MTKTCSIDDCAGLHHARGWCAKHYALWRRWGTPEAHFRPTFWNADKVVVMKPGDLRLSTLVQSHIDEMNVGNVICISSFGMLN